MPLSIRQALKKLGGDINVARRKRARTIAEVAEAAATTSGTVRRLEQGDPGVSLGVFAMVMLALGEKRRLGELLDVARDDVGLLLDESRLPKRVRHSKRKDVWW